MQERRSGRNYPYETRTQSQARPSHIAAGRRAGRLATAPDRGRRNRAPDRTREQADAAKHALGAALLRGDFATPERWLAAVAAIGADSDVPLEGVPDSVFAAIRTEIQNARLTLPDLAAPPSAPISSTKQHP